MKLRCPCDLHGYPIAKSDNMCQIVSSVQPEYAGPLGDAWIELAMDIPVVKVRASYDGLSYEMTHKLPREFAPDVSSFMSNLFESATILWHD